MMFHIGDKFVIAGVECQVAFVDAQGSAYLIPRRDGDEGPSRLLRGLVFVVIDSTGKDKDGNKAVAVSNIECGAV